MIILDTGVGYFLEESHLIVSLTTVAGDDVRAREIRSSQASW